MQLFLRKKGDDEIFILINLSPDKMDVQVVGDLLKGRFTEVFDNAKIEFPQKQNFELQPWGYFVYEKDKAL